MEKLRRRRYTLEYKQEAVRLVVSGQKMSVAAKALGIVEQTLSTTKCGCCEGAPVFFC